MVASGLHMSTLRTHQHCTVFKLLLSPLTQWKTTGPLQSPVSMISGLSGFHLQTASLSLLSRIEEDTVNSCLRNSCGFGSHLLFDDDDALVIKC